MTAMRLNNPVRVFAAHLVGHSAMHGGHAKVDQLDLEVTAGPRHENRLRRNVAIGGTEVVQLTHGLHDLSGERAEVFLPPGPRLG